jgi:phytoene synthase
MSRDTLEPSTGATAGAALPTNLGTYDAAAMASATTIIGHYSTSFGLAARLLSPGVRDEVRTIYALVRIADEIVDGAASEAGIDVAGQRELLDDLEQETERALARGFSTNLIVHAFATTARRVGIDPALTRPFFASMRRDLDPTPFTAESVAEYIYGSAEVVGLMCLRSFLHDSPRTAEQLAVLEHGARSLGAAFQKVNFLRDLAADRDALGRNYFPGASTWPGSPRSRSTACSMTWTPTWPPPRESFRYCHRAAGAPSQPLTACSPASRRNCAKPPPHA